MRTVTAPPTSLSFETLCTLLATDHGGYTLWFGAGAAKALCPSAPTWSELVARLLAGRVAPSNWERLGFSSKLEWLSAHLGHQAFRRALRQFIVEPMVNDPFDQDVAKAQAILGLRAGALVSFNIEMISATPFGSAHGGAFIPRPYLATPGNLPITMSSTSGLVCAPVFFPHGSLDVSGQCVITKSEYDLHRMSTAFRTSVALCLGGDLVILGMSLNDKYLRHGLLANRAWFRDVFWVSSQFEHREWARVANVHCVEATHTEMWKALKAAHLRHDDGRIAKFMVDTDFDNRVVTAVGTSRKFVRQLVAKLEELARTYASNPNYAATDLQRFAKQCVDLGVPVPKPILDDPRWGKNPFIREGQLEVNARS